MRGWSRVARELTLRRRRSFRLEGRVVNPFGQPVAAAELRLSPGRIRAVADDRGQFGFDDLEDGRYTLTARSTELCAGPIAVSADDEGSPIVVDMQAGATLVIHVSAEGQTIAGAKVILDHEHVGTTQAGGTAVIRPIPADTNRGWVEADGYAAAPIKPSLQADPGAVIETWVNLMPGARIDGVALSAAGKPIAGAWIVVSEIADRNRTYEAISDELGKWYLTAREGTYRLLATNKEREQTSSEFVCDGRTAVPSVVVQFRGRQSRHAIAELAAKVRRSIAGATSSRVAGIVVDDLDAPVAGARVSIVQPSPQNASVVTLMWSGYTDQRGRFESDDLPEAPYEVSAGWPDDAIGRFRKARPRRLVSPGEASVRLTLSTDAEITGRAVLDGEPMPYFVVALLAPKEFLAGHPVSVRSSDGRFVLRHVAPGNYKISIMGPGTRRKNVESVEIANGRRLDLGDIAMERGQRITGHVRNVAGEPAAGCRVIVSRLLRSDSDKLYSPSQSLFLGRSETTTDAEGSYVFEGVDAHIEGLRAPSVWAERVGAGCSLARSLSATDSTIDFVLIGTGRIEGVVDGLRGRRVHVIAQRADEAPAVHTAFVDTAGRFAFNELPAGDFQLQLDAPPSEQGTAANVTVLPNQTATARLEMTSNSVELTVLVSGGRGKDLRIEPVSSDARVGYAIVISGAFDGGKWGDRFSVDILRPGDYRVSLDGETWTPLHVSESPDKQLLDLRGG